MEYIYSALLLHKAGKQIEEDSVKKVLESAGVNVDNARLKALVASLEGVDIDKAIAESSVQLAQPTQQSAPAKQQEGKKEEAKKGEEEHETKKQEEAAASGLSALFG